MQPLFQVFINFSKNCDTVFKIFKIYVFRIFYYLEVTIDNLKMSRYFRKSRFLFLCKLLSYDILVNFSVQKCPPVLLVFDIFLKTVLVLVKLTKDFFSMT